MKITRKNLPKSIVELTVEETTENIAKFRKKAIEYLQKNAEIKGFRK
jgi:FKBP-type peptidyl-prolyl cis-trans isomerase (trigger factor)